MIIKLNKKQFDYLNQNLFNKKEGAGLICNVCMKRESFLIELDEDTIDWIRDWVMERQIFLGFDANYELTEEGEFLEELIDLFYLG